MNWEYNMLINLLNTIYPIYCSDYNVTIICIHCKIVTNASIGSCKKTYSSEIGRCFGGFFLKYSNNKFITSETGRACFSLIPSRNLCISSVVLIPMNFVRFCFISFTMLNNIILECNENNAKLYKTF